MFGPTTGDKVRIADTNLWVEVEKDYTVYGDECKFGGGQCGFSQIMLCLADIVKARFCGTAWVKRRIVQTTKYSTWSSPMRLSLIGAVSSR
jgi:hypothetical protein